MTLQRRTIRFSDLEWDRVGAEARRLGMPTSEFVREAVLSRLDASTQPTAQNGTQPAAQDGARPVVQDDVRVGPAERVGRTYTVRIEFTPPDR